MKPTSLIFLALSLVLFFGGLMTCGIASSMAASSGISIYEQTITSEGDSIYTYDISDDKLSKLSLTFSDIEDILIVADSERSYVELVNFDVYSYSTALTGNTVSIDGTVGMLSSLIDLSGGGLQFKGLRYFFMDKPDPSHTRRVVVHLANTSEIKSVSLTVKQGSVYLQNLENTIDYSLNVTNGNVVFSSVITESVIDLQLNGGEAVISSSEFTTFNASIINGKTKIDVTNYMPELISYTISAENSALTYNGSLVEQLKITSPAQKCLIKIKAADATVEIFDSSSSAA